MTAPDTSLPSQATTGPDHAAPVAYETVSATTIEPKAAAATYGAGAAGIISGFVLYLLSGLFWHGGTVPFPVEQVVLLLIPSAITFGAAYMARHVNRP